MSPPGSDVAPARSPHPVRSRVDTAETGDVGIDLGKTSCRVRATANGHIVEASASGAEGFAAGEAGLRQALAAVESALAALPAEASGSIRRIGVGAAGADAAPNEALRFAETLARRFAAEVTVASDALAAHAGALGGAAGTVLIAGTGAVAFHLADDGDLTRADGWGIWLGDFGSGRWIGQEGLQRVLQARDGIAPATALTTAAITAAGSLEGLPRYVSGTGNPERVLGSFAPFVLEQAEAGDAVAQAIADGAAAHLAQTAAACTRSGERLAVVGGLASDSGFYTRLSNALALHGLEPVPALDDAVAGALLICAHPEYPHERATIRVRH